jgi:hypothetical protein
VVLNTSFDPGDEREPEMEDSDEEDGSPPVIPKIWFQTVETVGKFSCLRSISVRFRDACSDGEVDYNEVIEDVEVRDEIMTAVFGALNSDDYPTPNLRSLTFKNLQDSNSREIVESHDFRAVMARLTELHLHIATENLSSSPENNVAFSSLHRFFRELPSVWLNPVSMNLTHLSLWCDNYWGWCPTFDPRGLHLPKLKYLSMGNFAFAHDFQLDWILSHGQTLEILSMDDCAILFYMDPQYLATEITFSLLHDDHQVCLVDKDESGDSGPRYAYNSRWHQYLRNLEVGLPHLINFTFGHGNWDMGCAFEDRNTLLPGLDNRRYMAFNGGIGPSQWLDFCRYGSASKEVESFGYGDTEMLVQSPAVREPPFHQSVKLGDNEMEDEDSISLGSDDTHDGSGCQIADQAAFDSIIRTVRARAMAKGLM